MKFGGFYEHQLPRPWAPGAEHQLLKNALEQVELSDRGGYDYVWATEHHFLEEYAHSSAPEVFLAACTQRTKNVRIGHGIVQMPPNINHPARVAERVATLDLLSDGRVEYGVGAGATETELGGFHVPQSFKKEMMIEGLRAVVRMFVEDPFGGFEGKIRLHPAAQRSAQALTEAAPAAMAGLLESHVDLAGRAARRGCAHLFLR
jgi:alkanesulfonate monooxygenase SsuD/methylene tetrahydromethanopterin reductase-like flavin-dependent oxidoreductase (luciferase family)